MTRCDGTIACDQQGSQAGVGGVGRLEARPALHRRHGWAAEAGTVSLLGNIKTALQALLRHTIGRKPTKHGVSVPAGSKAAAAAAAARLLALQAL